jgi:hypothetical protein
MIDKWFSSLKVGDKVYNFSFKWQNKQIIDKKLREGIIKEIHDNGKFNRYVIVDNLTTGRQNKWGDYDLVKPQAIQDIEKQLTDQLQETASITPMQNQEPDNRKTVDEYAAQAADESLVNSADRLLENGDVRLGKCTGIYGAFNKNTGECIYIGKSKSLISTRWREHARFWKKLRPIHRQPLLTKYLHFFSDQIEWRVLLPTSSSTDNDLIEYAERRLFEKYRPIANSIVPNGTFFGRSVLEGEGNSVSVSEWNPNMVEIRIRKGQFNGFSDGKNHFAYTEGA